MGKRILITGASGEIGSAIARRMAEGDNLFLLHGNRNRDALVRLGEELRRRGCGADLWLCDFGSLRETSAWPDLSGVDIFVHASGPPLYKMLADTGEEEWDRLFSVHVKSAYLICKRILPPMVRRRWGRILFISSVWGEEGASCEAAYSAAKGALNAFAKSLARELAPSGITVNAVAPGAIATGMVRGYLSPEEVEQLESDIPAGRLGTPEEVAHLVHFLAQEESSYITGQVVRIDGGWR